MFIHNGKISVRQVRLLLILQMFNISVLLLPRIAAYQAGVDGYFLPLAALPFTLIYVLMIIALTSRFQGDSLVEFAPKIVPIPIARLIALAFLIKIIISAGLELRMFGEMISEVMLPKTPLAVIMITLLFTAAYLVKSGIEATGRTAELLIYFVFIPLAIVLGLIVVKTDYYELLPVFQTDGKDFIKGAYYISLTYAPIEFMILMAGLMKKQNGAGKACLWAVVITAFIQTIVVMMTYTAIGMEDSKRYIWPVLTLMQSIEFPGSFVENQEILMMTSWVLSVFMYVASGLFFASFLISRSFRFKRENISVLPLVPVIYFVAMIPDSLINTYKYYIAFQRNFGIWFLFPVPCVLWLIAKLRKAGEST